MLDFVKKYLRQFERAINSIGLKFISKFCIDKENTWGLNDKKPTKSLKNELIEIKCYRLNSYVPQINLTQQNGKSSKFNTEFSDNKFEDEDDEDCNLSEDEEEKSQVQNSS